ncbi:MAG: hypothetical protein JXA73_25185 [Acidobacteria bacterium]|nr:hypothetical protein [Acidobacteriota bacterium]
MKKAAYAAVIGILVLFLSACVTGDEITSYVIEPDGAISFSIYRLNLTSDETGEDAKKDLANYIQELEETRGDLFTNFVRANALEVKVTVLRPTSPASVLITGIIPSLDDFAAYISEEDEDNRLVCTPISSERTRGLLFELIQKPSKEKAQSEPDGPQSDSFDEIRFSLAEGSFTKAQGFLLAHDKRSAILDEDALVKTLNSQIPSITLSLEWQIPEAPY